MQEFDISAFYEAEVVKGLFQDSEVFVLLLGAASMPEHAYLKFPEARPLLRYRNKRPSNRNPRERNEITSSHAAFQKLTQA
jgi:hypothetical protein